MAFADARCDGVDRVAVGDITRLGLAADLVCKLPQLLLAPREENAVPAVCGEPPRDSGADAARGAGDDC